MGGGEHWQRSNEELLRAVAHCEEQVRRLYAESLELIAELDSRDVAADLGYSGLAELLRDVVRLSTAEARRRISHATAVTETPLVSGGVVPPRLPVVATALRKRCPRRGPRRRLVTDEGALPTEGDEKPHTLVTIPLAALRTNHTTRTAADPNDPADAQPHHHANSGRNSRSQAILNAPNLSTPNPHTASRATPALFPLRSAADPSHWTSAAPATPCRRPFAEHSFFVMVVARFLVAIVVTVGVTAIIFCIGPTTGLPNPTIWSSCAAGITG